MGAAAEMLKDGPAFLYRVALRGSATTVADLSGNAKTLTEGGTVTRGVVGPTKDLPAACKFVVASSSRLAMATKVQGFALQTASAWIRTTSSSSLIEGVDGVALTIFGQQDPNQVWGSFGVHGGKVAFFRESSNRLVGNKTVSDGRWHHVAVQQISTTAATFWVDGAVDSAQTGLTLSGTTNFGYDTLGAHYKSLGVPGEFFDGDIALAAAYTSDIGAVRIRSHYLAGLDRGLRTGRR